MTSSILKPEDRVSPCFKYSDSFRSAFLSRPEPDFGFDGFGGFIFRRTYSRKMSNGKSENFTDTIIRVGEGIFSIRKHKLLQIGVLPSDFEKDAEDFCHYMYTMRMLAPGRALWACGTDFMYRMGSACLNNCAFISTKDNLAESMSMIMDYLMLGVGVGFDTEFKGLIKLTPNTNVFTYIIPDSREGWVDSVQLLIEAYTCNTVYTPLQSETMGETFMETKGLRGRLPIFDYSRLRKEGSAIKGFGGTASGSGPLEKLHRDMVRSFEKFISFREINGTMGLDRQGPSDYNYVRLVADIANQLGCCVVAGNVRRSAEICIGDPKSQTFLNLKNYDLNPERAEIGWMSNNTCKFVDHKDFSHIPEISERIKKNGEPGFGNFVNIQKYGRIGDHKRPEWSREVERDLAEGMNPCAEIPLEDGELCNLAEVFPSRCVDENGKFSKEIYFRALYYATLCASTVSLLMSHRERTNEKIRRNRRIGVSQTGIADLYTMIGFTACTEVWREGYAFVRECNHLFALQAGVPDSIRVTTVKPSGTLSLLAGVSPGMHFPTFRYAKRNVRVAKNTPIALFLDKQGVPHEPDMYSDGTEVFAFAIDQGLTREASQVPISEQFMLLVALQREWADNMVSVTIYFDPKKEGDILEHYIALNAPVIKSCSILPHSDEGVYPQSPYQRISRKEYRSQRKFNRIDWKMFSGESDGVFERFCNNDVCEIVAMPKTVKDDYKEYIDLGLDSGEDDIIKQVKVSDPPISSGLHGLLRIFY